MFELLYMVFGYFWGQGDFSFILNYFFKVVEVGVEEEGGIRWYKL